MSNRDNWDIDKPHKITDPDKINFEDRLIEPWTEGLDLPTYDDYEVEDD